MYVVQGAAKLHLLFIKYIMIGILFIYFNQTVQDNRPYQILNIIVSK